MTAMHKLIGLSLLVILLMAGGAVGAWKVQAWRYTQQLEHQAAWQAEDINRVTQITLHQQQVDQSKRLALETQLSSQDQQHTRALSDAQRDQAALRDRLATADVRLSVLLDAADGCSVPASTTGGVVHAAPRARLDPAHAQRIIGITDDGDNAVIALRACQAYVRAIAR